MSTSRANLIAAQNLARIGAIYAPDSFKTTSIAELEKVCNGCGSAAAKFDFIPDKIIGTYIGHACNVHDWEYEFGVDYEDKKAADRSMRNNLLRLIDRGCKGKWYKPRKLMQWIAQGYYIGVCWKGGPAFWKGKA